MLNLLTMSLSKARAIQLFLLLKRSESGDISPALIENVPITWEKPKRETMAKELRPSHCSYRHNWVGKFLGLIPGQGALCYGY
jgi:hypothetical protein